ncbi:MAG: alginate export family protein [Flavobacteriales bacterium]|nr:alginate export family protein [Flavobacteriales bacterium]
MKKWNTTKPLILLTACICGALDLSAQFVLSGEIRPRTEYLHGFKTLAKETQDPAFWTEQRSRLRFDYTSDLYDVGIVLQDIRIWGSTSQLNRSDALSSIHEAWAAIRLCENFSLKAGRQEVAYDDHRIFGNVGWAQQARSHDLVRLQYKDSTGALDLGLAFNQDAAQLTTHVYTVPNSYKTLQYLWWHKNFSEAFGASILFLNNGLQYSVTDTAGVTSYSVQYSQTAGTYLSYKTEKLKLSGSAYYQTGKDGTGKDLGAYQASAEANYRISGGFSLGAGYERLSGTSQVDKANTENNSFNPLYGTNHKFNGFMDYFYVGNHTNGVGLQDSYFRMLYKYKKLSAGLDVHLFSSAADILDVEEWASTGQYRVMSSALGTEFDATFIYKLSDEVSLQAGYSQMFATESMEALKGGSKDEINNWAYLMITVKPVFYKSKDQ